MTRDEILNMPAGRDMDTLIAEHVFRWEKGTFSVDAPMKSIHGDWMVQPIPYYSDAIEAAWQVVEYMPDGYELRLHEHKLTSTYWQAEFHKPGQETYMVRAKTAPLAICRAALLAVIEP